MARVKRLQKSFILALGIWLLISTGAVTAISWHNRVQRAILGMGWGLITLWILAGGSLMYLFRDRLKAILERSPLNWKISFFLLATLLAMCEEAVTTSMTNCAPLFGVKPGEAYITASANYFDVIFCHSVVTFLPAFAAWAWLLARYDFSPFEVFLCFGIYGTLGESLYGGFQNLAEAGLWIFVYGLMVYLPAYVFADHRGRRRVSWPQYLMGTVGLFACTLPWVGFVKLVFLRHHPDIHFPPMRFD